MKYNIKKELKGYFYILAILNEWLINSYMWAYVVFESTCPLLLESAVDNRFDVSGGINRVAVSVDGDEDGRFGSWSSIF